MSGRQTNGPIRDQRGADVMQFPSIIHPYSHPCEETEPWGTVVGGGRVDAGSTLLNRATGDGGWGSGGARMDGWMNGCRSTCKSDIASC